MAPTPSMLQSPNANRNVNAAQLPTMRPMNANKYGISTAPPMMQMPSNSQHQLQSPMGMPPPPLTTAMQQQQQNQLNNNPQQQQQFKQTPIPAPPSTVRKPMYPSAAAVSNQMPPMLPPNTQQQQGFAPAYSTQQQTAQQISSMPASTQSIPGMFNGQTSNAPLQYQVAANAQQLQQQQQPMGAFPTGPSQYNPQMSVAQQGFSRLWGHDTIDLMQNRHILTPATLQPPKIVLHNQFHESINCNPK